MPFFNISGRGQPPPTVFRQSIQTHTDWVNDLLLCNLNQTGEQLVAGLALCANRHRGRPLTGGRCTDSRHRLVGPHDPRVGATLVDRVGHARSRRRAPRLCQDALACVGVIPPGLDRD